MKALSLLFAVFALLVTLVVAWEKEDHEIFDLVSELEASEGKGTTFYSFLDVPHTATTSEISKAYRKKSMHLHPDKNPNVKNIHERFARMGVIGTILRNKESRERYDFFYKNGVPKWRGSGYYYSRFRPGVGTVLVFLTIVTSLIQYLVQSINYKKDLARIDTIVQRARSVAWGPKLVPVQGQRKVRVNLGEAHDEEGVPKGTKLIDMVVDEQNVYLAEPNGDLHIIDASTATKPALTNTWALGLVTGLFNKVAGGSKVPAPISDDSVQSEKTSKASKPAKVANGKGNGAALEVDSDEAGSTGGSDVAGSGTSTPKSNGGPTTKAGGVRRKNVKRR